MTSEQLCALLEPLVDESVLGLAVEEVTPAADETSESNSCRMDSEYVVTSTSASGGSGSTTASVALLVYPADGYTAESAAQAVSGCTLDHQVLGERTLYAAFCSDAEGAQATVFAEAGDMLIQLVYTKPADLGPVSSDTAYSLLGQVLS